MPKLTDNRVPSYRIHRQSGQAVVTLNGRDVLLGSFNTPASKAEYNRRISEWIAAGRQNPRTQADLTVAELIARYKVHVEAYYRRADGTGMRLFPHLFSAGHRKKDPRFALHIETILTVADSLERAAVQRRNERVKAVKVNFQRHRKPRRKARHGRHETSDIASSPIPVPA